MGRSQRHLIQEHNTTSAGEVHAQGVVATSIMAQVDPSQLNVLTAPVDPPAGGFAVPEGASGGPLQGSSMSGAIPESVQPPPEPELPDSPDPEPGMEPTLTSLDPATAVLGDPDLTLRCIGTNFTDTSLIHFSDHDEPTTFVSDTELTTGVKPSLGWGAVAVPVTVRQGSFETGPLDFTFTDGAQQSTRSFPLGPFNLIRVEPVADPVGVRYVLSFDDGQILEEGDTVAVEATGSTPVNGTYTVAELGDTATETSFFVAGTVLAAQIDAKGRLTVTAGA
jgi:hypothetical protein